MVNSDDVDLCDAPVYPRRQILEMGRVSKTQEVIKRRQKRTEMWEKLAMLPGVVDSSILLRCS